MDRPRLLVVVDDLPTRKVLDRLFTVRGWQVRCCAGVTEALRDLGTAPDCAIVDLALPDGDGERVLEAIRAHCPRTFLVVVSGIGEARRLEAVGHRLRPQALLMKPVAPEALFRVCDAAKGRGSVPSEPSPIEPAD